MDIAFNINSLGLEGLGSTLSSLIKNCSSNKDLKLWFLCSDLGDYDKENISRLLHGLNYEGESKFVDFDAKASFGHLKPLHGDWTAYGRLLIPRIVKAEKALYLDSDLIIQSDVLKLKDYYPDRILAAVAGCTVKWALEHSFFIDKLNWDEETNYFNSGVLLFNITKWNKDGIDLKISDMASRFANEFLSADQTLLNAICKGEFTHLPEEFNIAWYPGKPKPENSEHGILHFVGSPKPWDMSGKVVHEGFRIWQRYNTSFWKSQYGKITFDKIKRTWKIRRSLYRNLKTKLSPTPTLASIVAD